MSSWDCFKYDPPKEICHLGEEYQLEKDAGYPWRKKSLHGDRPDKDPAQVSGVLEQGTPQRILPKTHQSAQQVKKLALSSVILKNHEDFWDA